jgi:signal transduction histidine kinase
MAHADHLVLGGTRLRRSPLSPSADRWRARILGVPLLWKLFGANAIIVLGTATTAIVMHVGQPEMWLTMSAALLATFIVNGGLVYLALRPLKELEEAAARVSRGERNVRVRRSPLADRNMMRVGESINRLVDRLTADRFHMRKLAAQVITAGEEERASIARQLQDSSAQTLAALSLQVSSLVRDCGDPAMRERLSLIHELSVDALEEIRSLALDVYPRVLDDLGLPAALQWLARRATTERVRVSLELGEPVRLPRDVESVLYQVASEGVANAIGHGNPSTVVLSLTSDPHRITLRVRDDGVGFDPGKVSRSAGGFGLFAMEERVSLVDGTFEVGSAPGEGTSVTVSVPLREAA